MSARAALAAAMLLAPTLPAMANVSAELLTLECRFAPEEKAEALTLRLEIELIGLTETAPQTARAEVAGGLSARMLGHRKAAQITLATYDNAPALLASIDLDTGRALLSRHAIAPPQGETLAGGCTTLKHTDLSAGTQ